MSRYLISDQFHAQKQSGCFCLRSVGKQTDVSQKHKDFCSRLCCFLTLIESFSQIQSETRIHTNIHHETQRMCEGGGL